MAAKKKKPAPKFKTIVADPPWNGPGSCPAFDHKKTLSVIPYATMTGIQCATLNIAELAAPDAQLWLWTTSRNLGDAYLLGQAWAFKFRACFVWQKGTLGLGKHARGQCEFLLWFARRGARMVEPTKCPRQIQTWKKPKAHSEKPAAAYRFIRSLSDGPRLDLFARQTRDGFTPWGNQVGLLDSDTMAGIIDAKEAAAKFDADADRAEAMAAA